MTDDDALFWDAHDKRKAGAAVTDDTPRTAAGRLDALWNALLWDIGDSEGREAVIARHRPAIEAEASAGGLNRWADPEYTGLDVEYDRRGPMTLKKHDIGTDPHCEWCAEYARLAAEGSE